MSRRGYDAPKPSPIATIAEDPALKINGADCAVVGSTKSYALTYGRKDIPPGISKPSDLAKATKVFVGGYSRSSLHDTRLRLSLELLGAPYQMVTGFQTIGAINKAIVASVQQAGGRAVGISGKDGNLLVAERFVKKKTDPKTGKTEAIDFGFVGEPVRVNTEILDTIMKSDAIPVIAPVGVGWEGETYNVNADTAAGAIATATKAKRLLLLTDVAGVLDRDKKLISELRLTDVPGLIADGTITGGMIPKVESAVAVVESGVEGVIVLDGRVPHSVLLELLTPHGVGTRISRTGV